MEKKPSPKKPKPALKTKPAPTGGPKPALKTKPAPTGGPKPTLKTKPAPTGGPKPTLKTKPAPAAGMQRTQKKSGGFNPVKTMDKIGSTIKGAASMGAKAVGTGQGVAAGMAKKYVEGAADLIGSAAKSYARGTKQGMDAAYGKTPSKAAPPKPKRMTSKKK
jgi:hypothetical protein